MKKYNKLEIVYFFMIPTLMMISFYIGLIFNELENNILALTFFILGFVFLMIDIIPGVILHRRREKVHHPRKKKYYKKLDNRERRENN